MICHSFFYCFLNAAVHILQLRMLNLKLGCWNINNLKSAHFDKTQDSLFREEISLYDIFCLQEVKLDSNISIDGYHSIFAPRPRESGYPISGGMLILVNPKISKGISLLQSTSSELQWIKLCKSKFGLLNDLFVCFVYIAPSNSSYSKRHNLEVLQILENDLKNYTNKGNVMILGDTNARTGEGSDSIDCSNDSKYMPMPCNIESNTFLTQRRSRDKVCCSRGKDLLDLCVSCNLQILNGRTVGDLHGNFTSFQYHGNSVVDYCLVSDNLISSVSYFQISHPIPFLSDHAKISVMFSTNCNIKECTSEEGLHVIPDCYKWCSTASAAFQAAFKSNEIRNQVNEFVNANTISSSNNLLNINSASKQFKEIILNACKKSLKMKIKPKVKSNKTKPVHKKWFDFDLIKMRKILISKSNQYAQNPFNSSKRDAFYKFRKLYNKLCKKKKREFIQVVFSKLDSLADKDPEAYWKLVKDLKEDVNNSNSDPARNISNEVWTNYFNNLFSIKLDFQRQNNYFNSMLESLNFSSENCSLDKEISEKEILDSVKDLKNNKAAGLDGIKNEMLKYSISYTMPCLHKLFNMILSSGCYPQDWKSGYIKPLYKNGKTDDPSNYRGISVLSCVAKLFNSILNKRLQTFLQENNVINDVQIGFQPRSRTSDHMFVLRTLIEKYRSCGSKLFACFIDFSKAFDTVLHSALFVKLHNIGVTGKFLKVLTELYNKSKLCVKLDNYLTKSFTQSVGVKQGDNLSPNLFKIFVNDLPHIFSTEDDPVVLDGAKLSCMLYADDLILLSSSYQGLQRCLDKLSDYCEKNCLAVNLCKTNVVVFCKGKPPETRLYYRSFLIDQVSSYKYLGIVFSSNGTYKTCQEDLYKRALRAYFKLVKCLACSSVKVKSFIHLFDHTIKPILTYACEIWGTVNTDSKVIKKQDYTVEMSYHNMPCEKLHLKALKFALGVHKKATNDAVYGETGRYPLHIDILYQSVKYLKRLAGPQCPKLLQRAFNESCNLCENGKTSWVSSIYFAMKHFGIEDLHSQERNLANEVKSKAILEFKQHWSEKISNCANTNSGKLRTYGKFKCIFKFENYLNSISDVTVRECFTKFRISAHKLQIEYGRYRNIPVSERLCTKCSMKVIEDELHFMFICPHYEIIRNNYLLSISSMCKNFNSLSCENKFIFVMSNEDDIIIQKTAEFIKQCHKLRPDH